MLMEHVTRDRQQVGFGAADLVVTLHPQETQEHLLRQVGNIRRVSQSRSQKTPQTTPVPHGDLGYELAGVISVHNGFR
jgi:hypothetical protein